VVRRCPRARKSCKLGADARLVSLSYRVVLCSVLVHHMPLGEVGLCQGAAAGCV